jgi:hypothetical protein
MSRSYCNNEEAKVEALDSKQSWPDVEGGIVSTRMDHSEEEIDQMRSKDRARAFNRIDWLVERVQRFSSIVVERVQS